MLIETVFAWPGFGQYLTNNLLLGDMNAVMVSIAHATDPYWHEISEAPDSHTRAHTTSGVPE